MLEIVKENVHRIVAESAFQNKWKAQGFTIYKPQAFVDGISEPESIVVKRTELEELRAEAMSLGIKPHHSAKADRIRDMIANYKAAGGNEDGDDR